MRLLFTSQIFQIGSVQLQVECTEPSGLGIVTERTEICAKWDTTPELEKIYIAPFLDTLPRAYKFEIFVDYLQPYLQAQAHSKFSSGELFTYNGVKFQVQACEPDVRARVGKGTAIFCEGAIHPPRTPLPQPIAMDWSSVFSAPPIAEASEREIEDMQARRRGLFEETLTQIEGFTWPPSGAGSTQQDKCMVCLCDFEAAERCRWLPCRHVFHARCVDEWLRRCTDCPICKVNVDRAIRNY